MWESESDAGERGLVPVVGGSDRHDALKNDGFVRRDQSWFVNSDIPSDLLVRVGDVSFHLHKVGSVLLFSRPDFRREYKHPQSLGIHCHK